MHAFYGQFGKSERNHGTAFPQTFTTVRPNAIAGVTGRLNSSCMRFLRTVLLVAVLDLSLAAPLFAQRSGIVGTVADTLGNMLQGVLVELSGTDFGSITNKDGEFRLLRVKPGPYVVSMRRVGFEALSMKLDIRNGDPMELDFELTPTQVRLAPVIVREEYLSEKLKRVGFENRLKTSGIAPSRFITRADIEKRNPLSLTHLLERQGGRVRNCADAIVYIDGVPPINTQPTAPTGALGRNSSIRSAARAENPNNMDYRALEAMPVRQVDGMEIYTSISEIPIEYRPGGNSQVNGRCVILVWTRER